MIELIIVWLYLAFICLSFGYAIHSLCNRCLSVKFEGLFINAVLGFATVTVVAEYMSLFVNIGKNAVIVLAILAVLLDIICLIINRKEDPFLQLYRNNTWVIVVMLLSLAVFGLYFSTMTLTTEGQGGDTYAYHAQAVRWIDDYGCVKGIANLNTRLGFNNAAFAFHAIGTFNELFETKMHCTMGFLFLMLALYLVEKTIIDVKKDKYINILFYVACFFYILKNAEVCSTYLTDYPANIMVAFILIEWLATFDENVKNRTYKQSVIAVLCVFLTTLKFSFCFMVILAILPGICLIKGHETKKIIAFVLSGVLVLLPFLIRNYYVSGWLLYPFAGIDIFNVEWKLPLSLVENEAYWVYSYGRLPGDNTVLTMESGAFAWLPAWFAHLPVVQKCEVLLALLMCVLTVIQTVKEGIKKIDISDCIVQSEIVLLIVIANLVYWFVTAPDIRFVSILLVFVIFETPMVMLVKRMSDSAQLGQVQIVVIAVMSAISLLGCSTPIVNTAVYLDSIANIKSLFTEHQVWQYENCLMEDVIDGKTVYRMVKGMPAYHDLPAIYGFSDSYDIHLLGDNIEDGFYIRQ